MQTRNGWRTICTARGHVEEEGSHDSFEIYWALKHGSPGTYATLRIIDETGRIVEGEGAE